MSHLPHVNSYAATHPHTRRYCDHNSRRAFRSFGVSKDPFRLIEGRAYKHLGINQPATSGSLTPTPRDPAPGSDHGPVPDTFRCFACGVGRHKDPFCLTKGALANN